LSMESSDPPSKRSKPSALPTPASAKPSGSASKPATGVITLRMHGSLPSEATIVRPNDLVIFGKNVSTEKLREAWAWVPDALKAKVVDIEDVVCFSTNDTYMNSCHGAIWCESGGQIKVRVLNSRFQPPASALQWTSATGGVSGKINKNDWRTAYVAGDLVSSDWPLPSTIQYMTVGVSETAWIRVEWKVGELLCFACSPNESELTNAGHEIIEVRDQCRWGDRVKLFFGGTLEQLKQSLHDQPTKRFLFSGHADLNYRPYGNTLGFVLPGGALQQPPVEPAVIASLLCEFAPVHGGVLELVVLNGCDSYALGCRMRGSGMPNVVCWGTKTLDPAGRLFATSFFKAVAAGKPLKEAFANAVEKVAAKYQIMGQDPLPAKGQTSGHPLPGAGEKYRAGVPVLLTRDAGNWIATADGRVEPLPAPPVFQTGPGAAPPTAPALSSATAPP